MPERKSAACAETRIRPSENSDAAAVAAIYAHYVLNALASFEIDPPSAAEMARRRAEALRNGMPYIVAERNGEVVGYAYAAPYHARPAYRSTVEDSIYVRAGHARQGIWRGLLSALLRECERRDFRQVIAVIGDSGNTASIRLHAQMGFRKVGVLKSVGFKFGRWVDVVQMQRELGAGHRTARNYGDIILISPRPRAASACARACVGRARGRDASRAAP